jgi:hypothetical protein
MQPNQPPDQAQAIGQTDGRQNISSLGPPPSPAPTPESLHSVAVELRDPASTIAGRSGFFATPDLRSSVEVQIPLMPPDIRAEYDQISVSDVSGTRSTVQRTATRGSSSARPKRGRPKKQSTTIEQSAKDLNLRRFAYNGRGSPTLVPKKRTGRASGKATGGVSSKATTASKTRKPRGRPAKNERLVARSLFARAVKHHRRQRAGEA